MQGVKEVAKAGAMEAATAGAEEGITYIASSKNA